MAGFIAGSMFIFIAASSEDPLEAAIDGKRVLLNHPRIFSRYASELQVDYQTFKRLSTADFTPITLFTPYKTYRPEEEVPLTVIAPLGGGKEVDLEWFYNGQPFRKFRERLDENGCLLKALKPGLEGKWQVKATRVGQPRAKALSEFEVSGYTLSVLRAQLRSQTYEARTQEIAFAAGLDLLGHPCRGTIRADLQCGFCRWRGIDELRDLRVEEGSVRGTFRVGHHTGPFLLVLHTPEGHTASLLLQQSARERRELKPLSTLGRRYEMSLMPLVGSREVRGIHLRHRDSESAPFVMREVVGDALEIEVTRQVSLASVATVNPITQEVSVEEYRGLEAGGSLRVKTQPPYTPILIGGYVDGRPYEAWGMGLSPLGVRVDLRAPTRIRPSESLSLEISTRRKARVLLVVGDPRLLRACENPCLELSASLFRSMAETARDWKEQALQIEPGGRGLAPPAGETGERGAIRGATRSSMSDLDVPAFLRRGDPSSLRLAAGMGSFGRAAQDDPPPEPALGVVGGKEDPVASSDRAPLREEETAPLLYCRLLEVDRKRVEPIPLPDRLASYQINAYLIDGADWASASLEVEVTQPLWVRIEAPEAISPGSEVEGRVLYRSQDLAQVTISTPDESLRHPVLPGQGALEFPLRRPGRVRAWIEDAQGERDAAEQVVHAPLQRRVWVSEIRVLGKGEWVEAPGVTAFPGYPPLLGDTVEGLLGYPYGCNEQISAQVGAAGVVYAGARRGLFDGEGEDKMGRAYEIIQTGLGQLRARNPGAVRLWPLWPRGNPEVGATVMIARNLLPLIEEPEAFPLAYDILAGIREGLLRAGIREASLIPLDPGFYDGIPPETVEEAAFAYLHLPDPGVKESCLAYIRETAQVVGEKACWKNTRAWAGPLEATCCAAQALYLAEDPLREKAFRYIAGCLQGRTLFSTRDTVELIKLLGLMAASSPKNGRPVVIVDGREAILDRTLRGQRLEVKEGQVIARIEREEMRYLRAMKSGVPLRVEIDNPSPRLGEKVQITIRAEGETRSPVAYIDLPPMLAAIRFGAQAQRLCLPVEQGAMVLETVAIRRGRAHLWVGLADMYDAGLWGTVPGIGVVVF